MNLLNSDQISRIEDLLCEGKSIRYISSTLGFSRNTIARIASEMKEGGTTGLRCINCHKPIEDPNKYKPRKFCSDRCRFEWHNNRKRKASYICSCVNCGIIFTSYGNRNKRFCSDECKKHYLYDDSRV